MWVDTSNGEIWRVERPYDSPGVAALQRLIGHSNAETLALGGRTFQPGEVFVAQAIATPFVDSSGTRQVTLDFFLRPAPQLLARLTGLPVYPTTYLGDVLEDRE